MTEANSINVTKYNDLIVENSEKIQSNKHKDNLLENKDSTTTNNQQSLSGLSLAEGGNYWKLRYEKLLDDYNNLLQKNQNLEDKLLDVVECFEKKKEELITNIEHEKTTLMADVNKLSTKLVDARIKLHDYEEKELIHASECSAPCHKNCQKTIFDPNTNIYYTNNSTLIDGNKIMTTKQDNTFDPNLV